MSKRSSAARSVRTILHRKHVSLTKAEDAIQKIDLSEKYRAAIAVYDQTNIWPTESDPVHGKAMRVVNNQMRRKNNGLLVTYYDGFTADIYGLFLRRRYQLPVRGTRHGYRSRYIQDAIDMLVAGQRLSVGLSNRLRELYVDKKIPADDIVRLTELKFCF